MDNKENPVNHFKNPKIDKLGKRVAHGFKSW